MVLLHDMGQSRAHLPVHAIFSARDRRPSLHSEEIRNEIYAYMAGTLKNLDCHPIKIGGVEEHVHVFCSLSKNIALSDLIGRLKVGRPREAVLGLPSRNCTPRRGVGSAFRAGRLISLHPGLKRLGYSVRPLRGRWSLDIFRLSGFSAEGAISK